jgi:sugar lactone lactonase YvrE
VDLKEFQTPDDRVAVVEGLSGPEAVRYDPDQDVWFVGNMNGGERDGDGFVSRVSAATSRVEALRFAEGTAEHPLHAPRGGVHGFDRRSGRQLVFVDLTAFEPGFLNDIARGEDGALYVTDTGRSAVIRLKDGESSMALEGPELGSPNGITWDPSRGRLVLVPWEPGHRVRLWSPGETSEGFGPSTTPGRLDGIEPLDGRFLMASQSDSALHLLGEDGSRQVVRTDGAPADIGLDTRRRRVAVPYIALNRVDIWQLPGR